MTKKDFYESLGITKGASEADIKSAYRRLARKHHPDIDKSTGAAEKFKEVSEAYQVLSDPSKKKTYDQFGHGAFDRSQGFGGAGGPRTYSWSSSSGSPFGADFGGFEDPFDLFEQIFGMSGMGGFSNFRRRPVYQLNLTFGESMNGVTKEIEVQVQTGQGRVERKRMKIKVPAGVDNGTRMKFGEIDLVFQVSRHPDFLREGSDIFSEITVNIPQLVLGDTFEVSTVSGKVIVKVPPGTQPGSLVRLKGKGAPRLGTTGRGDHFVRVNLNVPKTFSKEERKLYEELYKIGSKKKTWF